MNQNPRVHGCQDSFSGFDVKHEPWTSFRALLGDITPESNTPGRVFLERKGCIRGMSYSVGAQILTVGQIDLQPFRK
jgi:hypothetical protein